MTFFRNLKNLMTKFCAAGAKKANLMCSPRASLVVPIVAIGNAVVIVILIARHQTKYLHYRYCQSLPTHLLLYAFFYPFQFPIP